MILASLARSLYRASLLAALVGSAADTCGADDFDTFLKPLFAENCTKCHGGQRPKGKLDLEELKTAQHLLARPQLLEDMIEVIEAAEMPPEDEPGLSEEQRAELLATLQTMLRAATSERAVAAVPIRRLNRFQYNNSVRDLFQLKTDVFPLPEKLMTRSGAYLQSASGKMPDRVEVACLSFSAAGGLTGVAAYPKDLRAAHGFDNQANQLTLSPLLLDAFLRLGMSIVDSPDFNQGTVGVWSELFAAPAADADLEAEVTTRLGSFLRRAFRGPVENATLNRYAAYTLSKIKQGLPFADSMKKAAAAALSSPMFLYRHGFVEGAEERFRLASNLSYFLWGSGPDAQLLRAAESGELAQPEHLNKTLDRMLADPRIERFLDTFPSQWMQLENVLAATPDPAQYRLFSLEGVIPASLQMVLEPLLLFDAVFIEDRPIVELIAPAFSYESRFLKTWYRSDLQPPPLDIAKIAEENRVKEERLEVLDATLALLRAQLEALEQELPALIAKKLATVDLSAGQAEWEANEERMLAERPELSLWQRIGPFGAANFDEAHARSFIDEAAVDLKLAHGELQWTEEPGFVDGKGHALQGASCATYLYRTIRAGLTAPLGVSLGTDDSFKMWLNGELVAENKVTRGLAPDQEQLRLELLEGQNTLLLKVVNGGGGYGFYFKALDTTVPEPVLATLRVPAGERSLEQTDKVSEYYLTVAPELAPIRVAHAQESAALNGRLKEKLDARQRAPKPKTLEQVRQETQKRFDDDIRNQLRSRTFERVAASDPRYGGVITNAAMLSMTSGPKRTHPIARGAWIIEVIFNDPPPPPPNDVPALNEDLSSDKLTIRERFAEHRANPDCAGCHSTLDPLGFALENFDITGRWRDVYLNGRDVDPSGTLMKKHAFEGIVQFKESLVAEERRFAKAFTGHLLRFALSRELEPGDSLTIEDIVSKTEAQGYRLRSIIREVVLSDSFLQSN